MHLGKLTDVQAEMIKEILKIYQKQDTKIKGALNLSDSVYKRAWNYLDIAVINYYWKY